MRITRETLIRLARETVEQRCRSDRGIITVYLVGSLLGDEPLLGGTADIDLVFIHDSQPATPREFSPLSDEILLDLTHLPQALFRHPRELRTDPWLGSDLYANPLLLHDTQHWFEFTQAGARSQFTHPENVLVRARRLSGSARQAWLKLHAQAEDGCKARLVSTYLEAIEQAANAVAALSGSPLAGRRFLLHLPARAEAAGQPDLPARLAALLGDEDLAAETVRTWLPGWAAAYREASRQPGAPVDLHPDRQAYFEHGIGGLLDGDQPQAALWPLLQTWSLALLSLPAGTPHQAAWQEAAGQLHLSAGDLPDRLTDLDAFLDTVDESIDRWASENGAV